MAGHPPNMPSFAEQHFSEFEEVCCDMLQACLSSLAFALGWNRQCMLTDWPSVALLPRRNTQDVDDTAAASAGLH